jgi:esterase/lipase superfamily enzyme
VGTFKRVSDRAILAVAVILTGCAAERVMMPTPNVLLEPTRDFFAGIHRELQSTEVPLFYVTDRAPETDSEGGLRYGHERSFSVAFGSAVVDLGRDLSWEDLVAASRTQSRLKPVELELREVSELSRTPDAPLGHHLWSIPPGYPTPKSVH